MHSVYVYWQPGGQHSLFQATNEKAKPSGPWHSLSQHEIVMSFRPTEKKKSVTLLW